MTSLTGANGTVAASYDYDAFGNHLYGADEPADNNPFRYSGYEFDEETDLYYLKSRFYSSETARFMQEDTYRGNPTDPLSLNLYVYCAGNPLSYWDPTGFSYNGTRFNSFEEFYQYTLTNAEKAQELMYSLNANDRSNFYLIINDYVAYQGGMRGGNANVYQIIYGAPSDGTNNRDMNIGSLTWINTNPNQFENYTFTLFDALNWMIQTGAAGILCFRQDQQKTLMRQRMYRKV